MLTRPVAVLALLAGAAASDAQTGQPDPYAARREMGPQSYTWSAVRQAPQQASPYGVPRFGAAPQLAAQAATRRAATIGLRRQANAPATKPFNTVVHEPTVSPYLNLYREESDEGLPNYYAFVRPQLDQQRQNREQAQQLQELERQVQQAAYTTPNTPAPSRAARYGDTGRFYGGWRR